MAIRLKTVATLLATLSIAAPPARALQYQLESLDAGKFVVEARGPIVQGDADRLRDFIFANIGKGAIVGFAFDSPGGNLLEGEKLAGTIRTTGDGVVIPNNATCASACFLIFAAGRTKLAGITALIGVHSASEGDSETLATMGMTTAMARDAAAYGVPPSIIGRMVTTEPGRIAWLTPAELVSMGVEILGQPDSPPTPSSSGMVTGAVPAAPAAPVVPAIPSAPTASLPSMGLAYMQGKSDRQAWESWFGNLTGLAHDGALFWASQRSLARPTQCRAAPVSDDWLTGCLAAQQRLGPIDLRRKSEPDYRAGWNSL